MDDELFAKLLASMEQMTALLKEIRDAPGLGNRIYPSVWRDDPRHSTQPPPYWLEPIAAP